jgi:hypothetical protein
LHTLYPPEHETLEVLRFERTGDESDEWRRGSNVWLRWFGDEIELGIYIQQYYIFGAGSVNKAFFMEHWWCNLTVSYGRVFNVPLPYTFWAQIYYDEVALTLNRDGTIRNGTIFKP